MRKLVPLILLGMAQGVSAQSILRNANEQAIPPAENVVLPFAFYSGSTGFAMGVAGGSTGGLQPQNVIGAGGFVGFNGSYGAYLLNRNLQLKPFDRLFFDATLGVSRWVDSDEYIDGNPTFPNGSGNNESSMEDFVESKVLDLFMDLKLKFVLPIGAGRDNPIATYTLQRGQLVDGATGGISWWNPLESGRTYIELQPFAYYREVNAIDSDLDADFHTYGVRLTLRWDNTDFPDNPTRGNALSLTVGRDFGLGDSEDAYTTIEGSYSHYIPLGSNDWFRQQVIALNLWAIAETDGNAPYFTGASIGGFDRMRGFESNRFHDRAAAVGTAELRLTPQWNLGDELGNLNDTARIDWVQFVLFAEVGRVAPDFSAELLNDVKWDAGIGIRALARKAVFRADFAYSEEGWNAWVMVGQSF